MNHYFELQNLFEESEFLDCQSLNNEQQCLPPLRSSSANCQTSPFNFDQIDEEPILVKIPIIGRNVEWVFEQQPPVEDPPKVSRKCSMSSLEDGRWLTDFRVLLSEFHWPEVFSRNSSSNT